MVAYKATKSAHFHYKIFAVQKSVLTFPWRKKNRNRFWFNVIKLTPLRQKTAPCLLQNKQRAVKFYLCLEFVFRNFFALCLRLADALKNFEVRISYQWSPLGPVLELHSFTALISA